MPHAVTTPKASDVGKYPINCSEVLSVGHGVIQMQEMSLMC